MANLIYETVVSSGRLPPSGSLREVLLITVWLRRQEIELNKARLLAAGFSDRFSKNNQSTVESFRELVDAIFPFSSKVRNEADRRLMEKMRKEAEKGVLRFSPITMKPSHKYKGSKQ